MDQLLVNWKNFWPDMSSVPDWLSFTATVITLFSLTSIVTVTQDLPGEEAPRFSFVSIKIYVTFMFNYWQIESSCYTVYMYLVIPAKSSVFLGSHLPNYITDPQHFINSSPVIIISGKVTLLECLKHMYFLSNIYVWM